MKQKITFLIMLCLLVSTIAPLSAQTVPEIPLLVSKFGKIYKLQDGELVELNTGEGLSYNPDYNPEGTQFVYSTWSQITLDYAEAQEAEYGQFDWHGELPNDIAIYDLATDTYTIVASQEENADPETLLYAARRSAPKWSFDGTKLAWTEVYPTLDKVQNFAEIYTLVVYDIETATSQVIAELPPAMYDMAHNVQWGNDGVYLQILEYYRERMGESFIFHPVISGGDNYRVFFDTNETNPMSLVTFVTAYNDKEVFAVVYPNGTLHLIDNTRASEDLIGATLMQYSAFAPDGLANTMIVVNANNTLSYTVTDPETQLQEFLSETINNPINMIQVSPDGDSVAYLNRQGMVSIWKDGESITIAPPEDEFGDINYFNDIHWGKQSYRVVQS